MSDYFVVIEKSNEHLEEVNQEYCAILFANAFCFDPVGHSNVTKFLARQDFEVCRKEIKT